MSHISKHHNHIYLFCPRCNEGFCRQQDFTRHDKNYAESPQDKFASKCVKSFPLNTPSQEDSYSDCASMPGGIQKTTPQRKQQPRSDGTPLETPDLVSSHLKEEVLEEDSTWVKEEEEEYDPSIDYRDHTEIKEEQEEDLPQEVFDGRDVSTIMRTLNIHEYPGQVTPNPHQHQQPPSSPAASPLNFPSPHYRSPSPGPSPSHVTQKTSNNAVLLQVAGRPVLCIYLPSASVPFGSCASCHSLSSSTNGA